MKTPFFSIPRNLALQMLITLCVGFGCAWPLLLALNLPVSASLCSICCCSVALLFSLADCFPRLQAWAHPLLFAVLAALVWPYRDHLQPISHALSLFMHGQPLALAAYSRVITMILCALLTSIGASLARSEQAFFPLTLLTIFELMGISFLGLHTGPLALMPLIAALLLSAGKQGVCALRLLPMAAAALALTLLFAPLSSSTLPAFESFAQKVQRTIDDYFFFTEPRTAFSLSQTGYQPYGAERLGGTATPTDEPVMQARVPQRALLRATIKNEYTGQAWADTTSGRRYLFVSPRFSAMRRDLFDQGRPKESALLPGSRTIEVTLQQDAASTLFLTQRFLAPKGEDIVSYFSPSSEVFATRSLEAGDRYTFSGRLLDAASQGIRRSATRGRLCRRSRRTLMRR